MADRPIEIVSSSEEEEEDVQVLRIARKRLKVYHGSIPEELARKRLRVCRGSIAEEPLRPVFSAPPFHEGARGIANDWNDKTAALFWNKTHKKRWNPMAGAVVDPLSIVKFLSLRMGPDGRPVSERIGRPEAYADGWFKCP